MADKSIGTAEAKNAMVKTQDGPVPADDPSHKLRLEAAEDLVKRAKNQLVQAEADLAKLKKGK